MSELAFEDHSGLNNVSVMSIENRLTDVCAKRVIKFANHLASLDESFVLNNSNLQCVQTLSEREYGSAYLNASADTPMRLEASSICHRRVEYSVAKAEGYNKPLRVELAGLELDVSDTRTIVKLPIIHDTVIDSRQRAHRAIYELSKYIIKQRTSGIVLGWIDSTSNLDAFKRQATDSLYSDQFNLSLIHFDPVRVTRAISMPVEKIINNFS